jgi:hypothetical protein
MSCITALKAFEGKYDKKLNLGKLFRLLHIPVKEQERYLHILLEFQELFHTVLDGHLIKPVENNDTLYLKLYTRDTSPEHSPSHKKNETQDKKETIPDEIVLDKTKAILWNDVIYSFRNVRRGKGFNLDDDSSKVAQSLKALREHHPYLFFSNGNGLVYPSKLGTELGAKINGYIKANRELEEILVAGCRVIIQQ